MIVKCFLPSSMVGTGEAPNNIVLYYKLKRSSFSRRAFLFQLMFAELRHSIGGMTRSKSSQITQLSI